MAHPAVTGSSANEALRTLALSVTDGVATITLDRPERLNAFTAEMGAELTAVFDLTDSDDAVRAVIVTGRGRAFCAGADLAAGVDTFDPAKAAASEAGGETIDGAPRDLGGVVALRIAASRKPVIAAVNGPAVGVGATMTLPMDIRLASESARFGFVFARRGLVPEAASSWFLPRLVGISQAMEWVATGRVFPAAEALAGRLVSRVVPDAELLPAAREIAAEIAANTSPVAVAAARHLLWSMLGASSPWEAHRLDSRAIAALGRSAEVAEGVAAFLEKRAPRFPGSARDAIPGLVPEWPARPEDLP